MMQFESQVFELAKDVDHPEQNQDAWAFDRKRGVAAIADGVSSSLFARQWSRILTEAAIAESPDPDDKEAFGRWLARCRAAWSGRIDASRLAWFQKAKMREGAFSTLLWLALRPKPGAPRGTGRLVGHAVGDSCLFLVREGKTRLSFPIKCASQLEANPMVLGSVDLKRDELVTFARIDEECCVGDLVVLATDAVADWVLRRLEDGGEPNWADYWTMAEDAWQGEVTALREQRQMRYDDATLVLLRVVDPSVPGGDAAAPSRRDEPARTESGGMNLNLGPWKEKLKSLSDQVSERVSEEFSRGMEKLKEAKESAESAIQKYRDKQNPP